MKHSAADEQKAIEAIQAEFSDVDLGDARLEKRLQKIVGALAASPTSSFPEAMKVAAELEGFYRFVNNESVTFSDLTAPHARATAARIAEVKGPSLVIHDASEFTFPFEEDLREGCEILGKDTQGFYGAVSLALAADSLRPLGVLSCDSWRRSDLKPKNPHQIKAPKHRGHGGGRISGERWERFIARSEEFVADPSSLIHVIDREADGFPFYAELQARGRRFVIRLSGNRMVELLQQPDELVRLSEAATAAKPVHRVDVPVSRRRASRRSTHPARTSRIAKLAFAAMKITLNRIPQHDRSLPDSITLNVVCVNEVDVPEGEEPIQWLLATSESIDTANDIIAVVRHYKARWTIEEFFKTLKTGCALEERQLESMDSLLNVLAMSLVIAWHILVLRHESRVRPDASASEVMSPIVLEVLRASSRTPLKKNATVTQALYAVAGLGGHIKNNGAPGLITLSRGMQCLIQRVIGYVLGLQALGGLAKM